MMNTNLFSAIVVAMNQMDDVQGAKLLSVANALVNDPSTPSTKSTPTKSKAKKFGPAKDVTVGMKVVKNVVTIDERQGRDTWTVLSRRFETLGGSYNKVDRTITFKTQKDAKAFAKDNVVTGSERDGIRKEWAEKA